MKARDVMTPNVVSVQSQAAVIQAIRIMLQKRISGLPVVDDGRVVGILTEGDLLRRAETGIYSQKYPVLHASCDGLRDELKHSALDGCSNDPAIHNVFCGAADPSWTGQVRRRSIGEFPRVNAIARNPGEHKRDGSHGHAANRQISQAEQDRIAGNRTQLLV